MRHIHCSVALAFALALSACDRAVPDTTTTAAPSNPASATASASPADGVPATTLLGEFTDRLGFRRVYVQVPPGLSDAQLVAVAERLHARENGAWLWLLDSDAQSAQLLAALPAVEQGDASAYPRAWAEQHTVAHSVMELVAGERRSQWVLYKGADSSEALATLPCPPADRHCR